MSPSHWLMMICLGLDIATLSFLLIGKDTRLMVGESDTNSVFIKFMKIRMSILEVVDADI